VGIGQFSASPRKIAHEASLSTFDAISAHLRSVDQREAAEAILSVIEDAEDEGDIRKAVSLLSMLRDSRFPLGNLRRAFVSEITERALYSLFDSLPDVEAASSSIYRRVTSADIEKIRPPSKPEHAMVIDAEGFAPEGGSSLSRAVVSAYGLGWRNLSIYRMTGQRFIGCGIGKRSEGLRLDVFGSSGDYLSSGLDGGQIYVHGSAQDQVAQILNRGKLVVYGDVGQTFMYGAKGGEAYVLGNTAGRPLINAVGRPRVVINGTSLDYLAESFMAGDPLNGGGFVILNGLTIDGDGKISEQDTPYPGCNLFSLASGGAIYIRDPAEKLTEDQLNGGRFAKFTMSDWELIQPYLLENERLFGISVERHILSHDGKAIDPDKMFRKISAVPLVALAPTGGN